MKKNLNQAVQEILQKLNPDAELQNNNPSKNQKKTTIPFPTWEDIVHQAKQKPQKTPKLQKPPLIWATLATAAALLVFIWQNPIQETEPTQQAENTLSIQQLPKKFMIQHATTLQAKGIHIVFDKKTKATLTQTKNFNILLQQGKANFILTHSIMEKPLIVQTPHVQIYPLGTKFSLEVNVKQTKLTLTEGKLKIVYAKKAEIVNAPFSKKFLSQPKTISKYQPYIGKKVTLLLKKGDKLKGRIQKIVNGKIYLTSQRGKLIIPENDVQKIFSN